MRKWFPIIAVMLAIVVIIGTLVFSGTQKESVSARSEQKPLCAPSDFVVTDTHPRRDYGYLIVGVTIRNNCPVTATAKLRFTAFNDDGSPKFTFDFYATPAGVNISPNSDFNFEGITTAPPGQWRYSVVPIEVTRW